MTQHDDPSRLRHMLDAARKAVEFSSGKDRGSLDSDEKLLLSLTRLLEIIGEAAKNVSPELCKKHPEIPWKDIAGTRDRLSHGYFDVDSEELYAICKNHIPMLIETVKTMIGDLRNGATP